MILLERVPLSYGNAPAQIVNARMRASYSSMFPPSRQPAYGLSVRRSSRVIFLGEPWEFTTNRFPADQTPR